MADKSRKKGARARNARGGGAGGSLVLRLEQFSVADLRSGVNKLIELTWLTGLLMVPLVFNGRFWVSVNFTQPKQHIIHFTALIIIALWVFDIALSFAERKGFLPSRSEFKEWLVSFKQPYKLGALLFVLFALGHIISLALSPIPIVSFLARNTNDPGNDFYTQASGMVLFAAIFVKVVRREQVERIFWVIAITGSIAALYGLSQLVGFDPIGFSQQEGVVEQGRVYSTFGNPIFLSAYMLLSFTPTIVLTFLLFKRGKFWILPAGLMLAALQLAMLFLTDSRGPVIGFVSGVFIMLLLINFAGRDWRRQLIVWGSFVTLGLLWVVNWLADGDFSSLVFILGYPVVTISTLLVGFLEWRHRRQNSIIIPLIVLLIVESVLFFAVADSNIIRDYYYAVFGGLAFSFLLLWGTVTVVTDSRKGKKVRSGGFNLRRELGARFSEPRIGFIALLTSTALLTVVILSLISLAIPGTLSRLGGTDISLLVDNEVVEDDNSLTEFDGTLTMTDGGVELVSGDNFIDQINISTSRRLDIWAGAFELLGNRASPIEESDFTKFLRHIWGYGQEMYYLSYTQTAPIRDSFRIAANPHNIFLLVWLEMGLWGILTFTGLILMILVVLLAAINRASRRVATGGIWSWLITVGLLSLISGRLVEQMAGVGRVSDIFLFWAILGLALATYKFSTWDKALPEPGYESDGQRQVAQRKRSNLTKSHGPVITQQKPIGKAIWFTLVSFATASALSLFVFTVFDLGPLVSAARWSNAELQLNESRGSLGVDIDGDGVDDVGVLYTEEVNELITRLHTVALDESYTELYSSRFQGQLQLVLNYLNTVDDTVDLGEDRIAIQRRLLGNLEEALRKTQDTSPFAINSLVFLASIQRQLAGLYPEGPEREMLETAALNNWRKLEKVIQPFPSVLLDTAQNYYQLEAYEDSIRAAETVLNATPNNRDAATIKVLGELSLRRYADVIATSEQVFKDTLFDPLFDTDYLRYVGYLIAAYQDVGGLSDEARNEALVTLGRIRTDLNRYRDLPSHESAALYDLIRGRTYILTNSGTYQVLYALGLSSNHSMPSQYSLEATELLIEYLVSTEPDTLELADCYRDRAMLLESFLTPVEDGEIVTLEEINSSTCSIELP